MVKNTLELKNARVSPLTATCFENCWSAGQVRLRDRADAAQQRFGSLVAGAGHHLHQQPRAPRRRRRQHRRLRRQRPRRCVPSASRSATTCSTTSTIRAYGTNAKALLVGGGAAALVFDANTMIHTNTSAVYAYGAAMPGVVFTNNLSQHNPYGIMGDGATHRESDDRQVLSRRRGPMQHARGRQRLAVSHAELLSDRRAVERVVRGSGDLATTGMIPDSPSRSPRARGRVQARISPRFPAPSAATIRRRNPATNRQWPMPVVPTPRPSARWSRPMGRRPPIPTVRCSTIAGHWGDEVLVRAADLPATALRGSEWVRTARADAAGGAMMLNPDKGGRSAGRGRSCQLRRVHRQRGGGRPVPPVDAAAAPPATPTPTTRLTLQFSGAVDAPGRCPGADRHDHRAGHHPGAGEGGRRGRLGMDRFGL